MTWKIESSIFFKDIINAQKQIEGINYDIRKNLLNYDNVLSKQRKIIYTKRENSSFYKLQNIDDVINKFLWRSCCYCK